MTTVTTSLATSVVDVFHASLDQPPAVRRRLEAWLSDDERERARRFRFDRDRARFVVGRGLLRALLGRYTATEPAQLRFRYSAHEKPALAEDGPRFNLAHSGATALFAFSPSFDVGVDVELVRPELDGDRIAERFFSPREVEALRGLPDEARSLAFLSCWTRKEAFLKARGDGLSLALDSFDVSLAPGEPAALLRTGWSSSECSRWQLADLSDAEQGQVAALAAPAIGWRCVRRDLEVETFIED